MADTKKKRAGMTQEDLINKVHSKVKELVGWRDHRLSTEFQRVTDYYNGKLPKRQHSGSASYVATDVYDAVESMKAQLLETFAGNPDSLVSFPPQNAEDVESARVATEYCSYVVFRQNNGYQVFNDVIHDGLTARIGVAKVFWDQDYEDSDEEITGATYDDVQALAAQDDVTDLDASDSEDEPGVFNGSLVRRKDKSRVCILQVPTEEFLVPGSATCLATAQIVSHRTVKTRAELIAEGYDRKKIEEITNEGLDLELTPEYLARHDPTDGGSQSTTQFNDIQPDLERVLFFETYMKVNLDGRGVRLWKICHAGSVILSQEEVDKHPFFAFIPLPVPHTLWGNNFAARIIPTQNARTVLTRAILDHASITTNPRWGVVKGGLMNPKEMLDNRLGGIVNMTRPDAVRPLEQQSLNPFVFETLGMLKENKEEMTGISSLSQGLNKDAISTQNSGALVDNLVTLSQQRQKIIARNFAMYFLVPIYLEVYRLVLLNENRQKIVELAGSFEEVDPRRWEERLDCKVALKLGYGERERASAKYAGLYAQIAQDPALAPGFTYENRYALATDGMRAGAFENWQKYLLPPEKVQPPPPDPFKTRELDIKEKQANAAVLSAQTGADKAHSDAVVKAVEIALEKQTASLKAMLDMRDAERKDIDVANRVDVAQREVALLEEAPPPQDGSNAIISPNS